MHIRTSLIVVASAFDLSCSFLVLQWSCHGPILETLMKNILVEFTRTEDALEGLADADLLVNYNNIDKVYCELC